jgi:hypothetical protein
LVFIGGKGREFGAWVDADSRNNGFNAAGLIENPVYIIEDICRNELGLATADIDYVSFDAAGNTTDGDIENTIGLDAATMKYVLSVYQLDKSRKVIEKICKQSGCYFWFGPGRAKIKARRRTYTAVDDTIEFAHINIGTPKKTSLEEIKNRILVNYEFDYGAEQTINTRDYNDNASLEDSGANSSQSSDPEGYNVIKQLDLDISYTSDLDTADGIGEAYLSFLKDTKEIIPFSTTTPRYNHLEIGDVINFSGWDSNYKIFGTAPTTSHGWMITSTSKTPGSAKFEATRVPGTIS